MHLCVYYFSLERAAIKLPKMNLNNMQIPFISLSINSSEIIFKLQITSYDSTTN